MPIELRNSIVDEKPEADCCRGTISLPQRKIVLFANGRIVLAKLPSVIDAVIAALLLKMLWRPYRSGMFLEQALETAAFTIFLYPRMLGCAAEIDDHINRGRNMDTRTPASQCRFVA